MQVDLVRDVNSNFFHNIMKGRFRRNNLHGLNLDRGILEEVVEVKLEVLNYFKKYFSEPISFRLVMDGVFFNFLSDRNKAFLDSPFLLEAIREVVWLTNCDKSPRPDGFPLGFF